MTVISVDKFVYGTTYLQSKNNIVTEKYLNPKTEIFHEMEGK